MQVSISSTRILDKDGTTGVADWTLSPGDSIRRTDLHHLFGGSRQGGISPSAQSPNVFIFSDRASGEQHGYIDDWKSDGCFHYTGEGQRGDQRMVGGNRAILDAATRGRILRVFNGTGGQVEYQGRFELDPAKSWYIADAPETGDGPIRTVIVFRFRPVDTALQPPRGLPPPPAKTSVANVPVEARNTEKAFVDPDREPYEAERRESALVQRFKEFMERQGHAVERLKITPAGEAKPLFSDLYIKALGLLIEAKGSTDRMSIRMAIGQLIDYRRFVDPTVRCAVLVPCLPREDLLKLLGYAGVSVYYPTKAAFTLVSLPHHAFLVAEARERVHDVVVPDPEIGLEPDRFPIER
jgi:hypothetical protein